MTDAQKIEALQALVTVLESGLRIVQQTFYKDPPMPLFTKEATKKVVDTALQMAAIGTQSGIRG